MRSARTSTKSSSRTRSRSASTWLDGRSTVARWHGRKPAKIPQDAIPTHCARSPGRRASARPPSTACSTAAAAYGRAPCRGPPGDRRARPPAHPGPPQGPYVPRRRRDAGPGPVHLRRAQRPRGRTADPAARRRCARASTCGRPPVAEIVGLEAVRRRGSHGVLLKGPDVPEVAEAGQRLVAAGIPVVTLVTDVPAQRATGLRRHRQPGGGRHRGLPRRAVARRRARRRARHGRAASSAARRSGRWASGRRCGTCARWSCPTPTAWTRPARAGRGRARRPPRVRRGLLDRRRQRGDRSTRSASASCRVFVAHDLDADNIELLRAGRISAVLHHDLGQDMRRACHVIMQAHRALPGGIRLAVEHPGGDAVQRAATAAARTPMSSRPHDGPPRRPTSPEVLPCPRTTAPRTAPPAGWSCSRPTRMRPKRSTAASRVGRRGAQRRVRRLQNFTSGGVRVAGLMRNDGGQGAPDFWTTYLAVTDAVAAVEAAIAAGAQVHVPPMPVGDLGAMAAVTDPSGASSATGSRHPQAATAGSAEVGAPCWHELHTRDYAAAVGFYRTVLGGTQGDQRHRRVPLHPSVGRRRAVRGVMDASAWLPDGVPSDWTRLLRAPQMPTCRPLRLAPATASRSISSMPGIALVEIEGDDLGIAVDAQRELRQIVGADREAVEQLRRTRRSG